MTNEDLDYLLRSYNELYFNKHYKGHVPKDKIDHHKHSHAIFKEIKTHLWNAFA